MLDEPSVTAPLRFAEDSARLQSVLAALPFGTCAPPGSACSDSSRSAPATVARVLRSSLPTPETGLLAAQWQTPSGRMLPEAIRSAASSEAAAAGSRASR